MGFLHIIGDFDLLLLDGIYAISILGTRQHDTRLTIPLIMALTTRVYAAQQDHLLC